MLITLTALALVLQATPTPPRPPERPKTRIQAPEPPRWSGRHSRDDDASSGDATLDTTFAVRQGQRLSVDNFGGSIKVTAWNQDRIRVSSSGNGDPFTVSAGSVTLRISTHDEDHGPGESDLTLQVPAWMDLELSGNEVDISTKGTRGAVQANTVEGSITIDGGEGAIEANSVEGDIAVSNVRGRIQLNTTEGTVTLANISGTDLDVETVDGGIEMTGVTVPNVEANTVDGNIRWTGALAAGGTFRFTTHDGDLTLTLPGEPDATVSVDTFDGSLESDWPVTLHGTSQRKMNFTLGTGRARLELSSFDGTIGLKRGAGR
ncbi:MAG TPA: DUF4097 family beta strand repeat-containing protein [Gemmatimonadales bacterium]|nr:DUF4097 family beta strand repeat-containing protein [Gemmatimonadales bacterium]